MQNTSSRTEEICQEPHKSPPTALLIFKDGLNHPPIVVPNGGSEDTDELIMEWLERRLTLQARRKKAA